MNNKNLITKNDAIFYLEMIGSSLSPQRTTKIGDLKPYYKIIDERSSDEFKRFIWIYSEMKHLLTEKEQFILNEMYGVNKERSTLKTIGEMLHLGPERIRQIGRKAELKLARKLYVKFIDDTYKTYVKIAPCLYKQGATLFN